MNKTGSMHLIYTKYFLAVFLLFLLSACTSDFLDINEDPINPTEAELPELLTNSQINIANSLGLSEGGLSSHLSVIMHQLVSRNNADQYSVTGSDYAILQSWNHLYAGALEDLKYIIEKGTENGDMAYVGIAKILKAYAFSQMVDVWGDIPFSEANSVPGTEHPKFDDDETIYPKLFDLLNEGISDLQDPTESGANTPGEDDLIYGGNPENWIKAANTIKLKLYNQIRLTRDVSAEVNTLINEDNFISSAQEDFELPYGTSLLPENRNPGYIAEYTDGEMKYYISPWLYELMTGQKSGHHLSGITDPRTPYYWFRQVNDYHNAQNDVEYGDGGFVSIYFGSISTTRDLSQGRSGTVIGLYPCGGRFDDGNPVVVTSTGANSGPADVPFRMLTFAGRLFIQAELSIAGIISEDATTLLQNAILESMKKVNDIANNSDNQQTIENLEIPENINENTTTTIITQYIREVLAKFESANTEDEKLEIIITQKWISSFGNAVDSYTDYRRTGYPQLFDPNTMESVPPPDDLDAVPTQASREFPLSLPWPSPDLELNPNSPDEQKTPSTYRVFWDVD
jgi:hypothetical protein